MDVGEALTRKLGPLPAWAWGVGIGGAILAVRVLRGGVGGGGEPQRILVPTGGGAAMAGPDFVSDLGTAIGQIRDNLSNLTERVDDLDSQIAAPAPTAPNGGTPNAPTQPTTKKPAASKPAAKTAQKVTISLTNYVKALRRVFPDIAKRFGQPVGGPPGETSAQRKARLQAEADFIESRAGVGDFDLTSYIKGLRRMFPDIAAKFGEPVGGPPGETSTQRRARLLREKAFIESRAGIGVTTVGGLAFSSTGVAGKPLGATGAA